MDVWAWLTIAALCASGAIMPGLSLAVVVKNTIAGGRSQGVSCGLGHGIGIGIYALGAVVGFSALLASAPQIERGVSVLGGLFLLFLGTQSLRPSSAPAPVASFTGQGFREGFLTAFLNPKIAVFFLAILGSFIPKESPLSTRLGVALLAMSIDAGWYIFAATALAGSGADRWLADRGRAVSVVTGLLLVGVGLGVLLRFW